MLISTLVIPALLAVVEIGTDVEHEVAVMVVRRQPAQAAFIEIRAVILHSFSALAH